MIDAAKIIDIISNPSNSLEEAKEKLSLLDEEYEDIEEYITVFIGDNRFKRKTAKHRGVTRRKL